MHLRYLQCQWDNFSFIDIYSLSMSGLMHFYSISWSSSLVHITNGHLTRETAQVIIILMRLLLSLLLQLLLKRNRQLKPNFHQILFHCVFLASIVVHSFSSIDSGTAQMKSRFISSGGSDFYILLIDSSPYFDKACLHATFSRWNVAVEVHEFLFYFSGLPHKLEMAPRFIRKAMDSVLLAFTWKPMSPAACLRLCNRDSAWACVFEKNIQNNEIK